MSLEIRERHFPSFFEVPFAVYGERYPFVPMLYGDLKSMLDPARNPLFQAAAGTYYTAVRAGHPVGRIVALVHHAANQRFGEKTASFGFFDCEDDPATAARLLGLAEEFGRSHGCDRLRGAMNLTANQEIGVLTEGDHHRPMLAQVYNPAYVARLLEACGFVASHPMRTLVKRDLPSMDAEALLAPKHRGLLDDPRYCFRALDRRKFAAEVDAVREVLNDAMADNYLFVPLTPAEAQFQLGPLKLVLDPELVRIAEHDGQPVGIALGVPDVVPLLQKMKGRLWPTGWFHFLRRKKYLEDFSVIIILVKKAYQAQGVIRVLTYQLYKAGKDGGYKNAGGTWIGDDNEPSLKAAGAFGMERLHRLHMYEKAL